MNKDCCRVMDGDVVSVVLETQFRHTLHHIELLMKEEIKELDFINKWIHAPSFLEGLLLIICGKKFA